MGFSYVLHDDMHMGIHKKKKKKKKKKLHKNKLAIT